MLIEAFFFFYSSSFHAVCISCGASRKKWGIDLHQVLVFDSSMDKQSLFALAGHRWLAHRCAACTYRCTLCSVLSGRLITVCGEQMIGSLLADLPETDGIFSSRHIYSDCGSWTLTNYVVCLPVLLAEQMLLIFLFYFFFSFLFWCLSPLLLGVLTHGGSSKQPPLPTELEGRGGASTLHCLSHPGLKSV